MNPAEMPDKPEPTEPPRAPMPSTGSPRKSPQKAKRYLASLDRKIEQANGELIDERGTVHILRKRAGMVPIQNYDVVLKRIPFQT